MRQTEAGRPIGGHVAKEDIRVTRQADARMDGVEDEGKEDKRAAANDGIGRKESKRVSDRAVAGHARARGAWTD